jgi:Gas vesicle synthesis protein GvpL/GvpF/Gas vesicle synthesis protein GvpO
MRNNATNHAAGADEARHQPRQQRRRRRTVWLAIAGIASFAGLGALTPSSATADVAHTSGTDALVARNDGGRGEVANYERARVVRHDGLVAVVSDAPEGLRAKRRDLEAHEQVLESLGDAGPVLPMRFGSVAADDTAVEAELRAAGGGSYEDRVAFGEQVAAAVPAAWMNTPTDALPPAAVMSASVPATYRVTTDDAGEVASYERLHRYNRGRTSAVANP